MKRPHIPGSGSTPLGDDPEQSTRRTEIIHPESDAGDLDHPLDLPSSSASSRAREESASAPTTAMPVTQSPSPTADRRSAPRATEQLPYAADYAATSGAGSSSPETTVFPAHQANPGADPDSTYAAPTETGAAPVRVGHEVPPRGTSDLGLAILRIVLGGVLAVRALGLLFGLLGGPGTDAYADHLGAAGFAQTPLLATVVGAVMLVAAILLVLGLASPLALAALIAAVGLGLAADLAAPGGAAWDGPLGRDVVILGALTALLFTGPGRLGMDRRWRWSHRPRFTGFVWLVLGVAAVVAAWMLLRGQTA